MILKFYIILPKYFLKLINSKWSLTLQIYSSALIMTKEFCVTSINLFHYFAADVVAHVLEREGCRARKDFWNKVCAWPLSIDRAIYVFVVCHIPFVTIDNKLHFNLRKKGEWASRGWRVN